MVIGITGSFCSGKSAFVKILAKKGYKVIDADEVAHNLLDSDKRIAVKIKRTFGLERTQAGSLRGELRRVVFKDANLLDKLEEIIHPGIVKRLRREISVLSKKNNLVFVEVPLLFEKNLGNLFDKTVVVYASKKECLARAGKKGFSLEQAAFILRRQINSRDKVKLADFVIRNNKSFENLEAEADSLLEKLDYC